jgi:sulfur relay (sulfurtransferase) DsrC/TusE family protein
MENELTALESYICDWVKNTFGENDITPDGHAVAAEFKIGAVRGAAILARLRRLELIPKSNRMRITKSSNQGARHESTMEFIRNYIAEHGWAPSQREISDHISGSLQTVNADLQRLQKQGLIKMGPYPRQIRVVESVMKEAEVTM